MLQNGWIKIQTNKKEDEYPGVSSQTRVRLRAEQLFQEGAAKKAARKQEQLDSKQLKKSKQDHSSIEDRENTIFKASMSTIQEGEEEAEDRPNPK
eukprot:2936489-Heterocapsa_arctica.AAC.1